MPAVEPLAHRAAAVAMRTDTGSQAPDLGHQGRPAEVLQVRIQIFAHPLILPGAGRTRLSSQATRGRCAPTAAEECAVRAGHRAVTR